MALLAMLNTAQFLWIPENCGVGTVKDSDLDSHSFISEGYDRERNMFSIYFCRFFSFLKFLSIALGDMNAYTYHMYKM
jgi:hypothetical protein